MEFWTLTCHPQKMNGINHAGVWWLSPHGLPAYPVWNHENDGPKWFKWSMFLRFKPHVDDLLHVLLETLEPWSSHGRGLHPSHCESGANAGSTGTAQTARWDVKMSMIRASNLSEFSAMSVGQYRELWFSGLWLLRYFWFVMLPGIVFARKHPTRFVPSFLYMRWESMLLANVGTVEAGMPRRGWKGLIFDTDSSDNWERNHALLSRRSPYTVVHVLQGQCSS